MNNATAKQEALIRLTKLQSTLIQHEEYEDIIPELAETISNELYKIQDLILKED